MNFGSLFAGFGGFDLGLERAGMVCSWQVEIDDYLTRVLEKHWPDVTKYKDVRDVGKENLEAVDLICGGFPCQPHSVAGKQKGATDDRDLWPEYRRVIDEIRPRWVIGENVPGIRTTILDQVLSDLEDMAYTTGTLVIPACAFNAPHKRERVFIVAHTNRNSKSNITVDEQREVSRTMDATDSMREHSGKHLSRSEYKRAFETQETRSNHFDKDWFTVATEILRMVDGFPSRMDRRRMKALGNALLPQVAEFIGRQIMEVEWVNTRR